jgi:hypothetical protein
MPKSASGAEFQHLVVVSTGTRSQNSFGSANLIKRSPQCASWVWRSPPTLCAQARTTRHWSTKTTHATMGSTRPRLQCTAKAWDRLHTLPDVGLVMDPYFRFNLGHHFCTSCAFRVILPFWAVLSVEILNAVAKRGWVTSKAQILRKSYAWWLNTRHGREPLFHVVRRPCQVGLIR